MVTSYKIQPIFTNLYLLYNSMIILLELNKNVDVCVISQKMVAALFAIIPNLKWAKCLLILKWVNNLNYIHLGPQWLRKNRPALQETQETWVWFLGWEDLLEEDNSNPLQYSCLKNPMDREVWRATIQRVTKSWTQLSN